MRPSFPDSSLSSLSSLATIAAAAAGAMAVAASAWPAHAQPARPTQSDHEIRVESRADAVVGVPGAISLAIAPRPGHSISSDGPVQIELSAGDGLALPRARYDRDDAADPHADAPRFDLRFRATAPGRHSLRIALLYWVCGSRTCRPVRARREVAITAAR